VVLKDLELVVSDDMKQAIHADVVRQVQSVLPQNMTTDESVLVENFLEQPLFYVMLFHNYSLTQMTTPFSLTETINNPDISQTTIDTIVSSFASSMGINIEEKTTHELVGLIESKMSLTTLEIGKISRSILDTYGYSFGSIYGASINLLRTSIELQKFRKSKFIAPLVVENLKQDIPVLELENTPLTGEDISLLANLKMGGNVSGTLDILTKPTLIKKSFSISTTDDADVLQLKKRKWAYFDMFNYTNGVKCDSLETYVGCESQAISFTIPPNSSLQFVGYYYESDDLQESDIKLQYPAYQIFFRGHTYGKATIFLRNTSGLELVKKIFSKAVIGNVFSQNIELLGEQLVKMHNFVIKTEVDLYVNPLTKKKALLNREGFDVGTNSVARWITPEASFLKALTVVIEETGDVVTL